MFLVIADQSWEQLDPELAGAIKSAGIGLTFQFGRADAERSATRLGQVNPLAVKHEVQDPLRRAWTHPLFQPLPEQWEAWVQALQTPPPQHAFVQRSGGAVAKIKDQLLAEEHLAEVEAAHLSTCFCPLQ